MSTWPSTRAPGQPEALDQLIHAASTSGLNAAFLLAGLLGITGGIVAILTMRRPFAPPRPTVSQSRHLMNSGIDSE